MMHRETKKMISTALVFCLCLSFVLPVSASAINGSEQESEIALCEIDDTWEEWYDEDFDYSYSFPVEMFDDDFYGDILEQVWEEYPDDVTKVDNTYQQVLIKGEALEMFDELCMEGHEFENDFFPFSLEIPDDEHFDVFFGQAQNGSLNLVESEDCEVILKGMAVVKPDEFFSGEQIVEGIPFPPEMLDEEHLDSVFVQVQDGFQKPFESKEGEIILKSKSIVKFDESAFEEQMSEGVSFPAEMFDDEFYSEILDQVKQEFPELVEEENVTYTEIVIEGEAMDLFDELCYEKELAEGVPFPAVMFDNGLYSEILDQVNEKYPDLVETKDGEIIIKGDALQMFDELCWENMEFEKCFVCGMEFGEMKDDENGTAAFIAGIDLGCMLVPY
ncbi:hypothetical protein J2755_000008 [Methanohalophilus levihalophilus]|uniref:hypothetical protein n=1 Tax=Methanohalophilus levihalophilus TaxID=1431282 RepID=UPI001AEAAA57|nr:hypothetical protein [Methanohalophilus levihalophilus]MBP2029088.1 hypothetical protein [Methanohalophilus levihalophilus]